MKILLVANKVYKQEPHDNINGYTFHTTITTSSNSIMWHLPCHCYTCRDGCVKRSHFYVVVLAYALCQPVTPPFLVCELCLPVAPCIFLINNYSSFSAVPPTHLRLMHHPCTCTNDQQLVHCDSVVATCTYTSTTVPIDALLLLYTQTSTTGQ